MELQEASNSQDNTEKVKAGGYTCSDFKIYYKVTLKWGTNIRVNI